MRIAVEVHHTDRVHSSFIEAVVEGKKLGSPSSFVRSRNETLFSVYMHTW